MSDFYQTSPGNGIEGGGKKAPAQYREDVSAALTKAGIQRYRADLMVIDHREFILTCKRKKKTAQQAAAEMLNSHN